MLILRADAGDTIIVRHNQNAAATKNIILKEGKPAVLVGASTGADDRLVLLYDEGLDTDGAWYEVSGPQRPKILMHIPGDLSVGVKKRGRNLAP